MNLERLYLVNDVHAIGVADLPVELGAHNVGFARGAVGAKGVPENHMLMLNVDAAFDYYDNLHRVDLLVC